MTREEIIDFCDMKAQLEPENEDVFNAIIKALEQEPFINKPCVSEKVCEHDKNVVLDKIDEVITDALDKSTDQKESQTLRWVLDKISEVM